MLIGSYHFPSVCTQVVQFSIEVAVRYLPMVRLMKKFNFIFKCCSLWFVIFFAKHRLIALPSQTPKLNSISYWVYAKHGLLYVYTKLLSTIILTNDILPTIFLRRTYF